MQAHPTYFYISLWRLKISPPGQIYLLIFIRTMVKPPKQYCTLRYTCLAMDMMDGMEDSPEKSPGTYRRFYDENK